MKKMWAGRFEGRNDPLMEKFNRSLETDRVMLESDLKGSRAWALALARAGILSKAEAGRLVRALDGLLKNRNTLRFHASDEDVHMAVERLLTEKLGALGKKLHTGRSRNDQVALDSRLHMKALGRDLVRRIAKLMRSIAALASKHGNLIMPAYTHLQAAQPVLFPHYCLSFFFMLERDAGRFTDCLRRLDIMPLGSGALAGSGFAVDREFLRRELGFRALSDNSMDAVADRDHFLEFLSAAAITALHLSRFAEDLIIFSSPGYRTVELSDAYSTGSSMMPNKKNPDSLELIRGKSGRIFGSLTSLFVTAKGLPMTYNKDLQEDKAPLFDAAETLSDCLAIFTGVLDTLTVDGKRMRATLDGDLLATDLADALVQNGLPFRDAHAVVGKIVLDCRKSGRSLLDLSPPELKSYSPRFPAKLRLTFEESVRRRSLRGGTGPASVKTQLLKARKILKDLSKIK